jgi:hypothetical protein
MSLTVFKRHDFCNGRLKGIQGYSLQSVTGKIDQIYSFYQRFAALVVRAYSLGTMAHHLYALTTMAAYM